MSRFLLIGLAAFLATAGLGATEHIPAAPARYFNDYAGVVRPATADALNRQLEQFERDTSNQLLVVVYPKMESDSSVEDYTVRVAQAWHAGQAQRNNGAVLFAFMQEHQLYLQVGYGLEGAIPDATAKRIIEQEIVPRFRAGDVDGGMSAGVVAIMAAARGEYHGTGTTRAEGGQGAGGAAGGLVGLVIFLIVAISIIRVLRRLSSPAVFLGPGRRNVILGNSWWMGGGGSGGSSGSSWGGGGGFSGGGGSFGGGGAGGKW